MAFPLSLDSRTAQFGFPLHENTPFDTCLSMGRPQRAWPTHSSWFPFHRDPRFVMLATDVDKEELVQDQFQVSVSVIERPCLMTEVHVLDQSRSECSLSPRLSGWLDSSSRTSRRHALILLLLFDSLFTHSVDFVVGRSRSGRE